MRALAVFGLGIMLARVWVIVVELHPERLSRMDVKLLGRMRVMDTVGLMGNRLKCEDGLEEPWVLYVVLAVKGIRAEVMKSSCSNRQSAYICLKSGADD